MMVGRTDRSRQLEQGSALLITMFIMALMAIVGFAALETVMRDQSVAGFQKRQKTAFFAAEAGVTESYNALRANEDPTFVDGNLGDTTMYPKGQPTYGLDTTAGAATQSLGLGAFPGMNMTIGQNGSPAFTMRYWRVRVKGEAPGGSLARIETVSGRVVAN
jgi:hypothetical protein